MEYDCMKGSRAHVPFLAFEPSIDEGVYAGIRYNAHAYGDIGCIMWLSSLVFRQDRALKVSPSLHLSILLWALL